MKLVADLPVGENYSGNPFIATFWQLKEKGLALGDMEMVTPECDWTAGTGCDWLSFQRHDTPSITSLAKKTSRGKELERFELEGRPYTETL
jgi:hypothetical protein